MLSLPLSLALSLLWATSDSCPLIDESIVGTKAIHVAPQLAEDLAAAFNAAPRDVDLQKITYLAAKDQEGVLVTEDLWLDTSLIEAFADGAVRAVVPQSTCSHHYDIGSTNLSVRNDGALIASVGVSHAKYFCEDFDWICCRRLKCRKCRKELKTFVWQKTVTYNAVLTGSVVDPTDECADSATTDDACPYRIVLTEKTELDDRGGLPSAIKVVDTIVGSPLQKSMDNVRKELPQLGELFRSNVFRPGQTIFEKFVPKKARFAMLNDEPSFQVTSVAELTNRSYCRRLPELRVHIKYADSFTIGDRCHRVERGESWESIALMYYGWDEFGRALRRVNNSNLTLHSGDAVEVPALHSLMDAPGGSAVLGPGYHLWGVAEREREDVRSVASLNPHISNPDLVYPGDLIVTKEGANIAPRKTCSVSLE